MCKKIKLFYVVFFVFLFSSIVFLPSSLVYSAVPHLINYQGRLTDTSGAPLNGLYNITFRIYDAEAAGNLLWQGTYKSVPISKGIFSILLGDINDSGFNFEVLAFDKPYWLEIKVGDDVMAPRQRIASVGYAIKAEKAESAEVTEKIKANSVDSSPGYLSDKVDNSTIEVVSGKLKTKDLPAQFGTNGYSKLPGGLIIQWGQVNIGEPATVTFPIVFPNACYQVVISAGIDNFPGDRNSTAYNISNTGFTYNVGNGEAPGRWIAVGN